jgi:CheY-like chemotaxis protein
MSGDGEKCVEPGCDDYFTKPISREKLNAAVAAYADIPRSGSHAQT